MCAEPHAQVIKCCKHRSEVSKRALLGARKTGLFEVGRLMVKDAFFNQVGCGCKTAGAREREATREAIKSQL